MIKEGASQTPGVPMFRFLLFVAILGSLAAFLTRPTEAEIRDKARTMIEGSIEQGELDDVSDPALALLVAGCKADAAACADVLVRAIDITYGDRRLYARVGARGFGRSATCYAAFTKLYCPDGLVR